jgi:hypothetical protein
MMMNGSQNSSQMLALPSMFSLLMRNMKRLHGNVELNPMSLEVT